MAEGEYDATDGRARIRLRIRTVPIVGADRNGRAGRHARRIIAAKRRASLGGHRLASVSSAAVVAPHHGAKAEAQAWVLLGEVSEHGMDGNAMLERASATHPLRLGQGVVSTGGGARNSPIVSVPLSHPITSISGFLAQVSGVTSESDPTGAGRWSLQLNANTFNSPLCGGQVGCSGWQQFIADNPGNVYIQYWLIGHANPCPATPSGFPGGATWTYYPGAPGQASGCYINGNPNSGTPTGARRPAGTSRHGRLLVHLTVVVV